MKKTKFLMPILGIGAVAATVAPMVTMTACNKKAEFKLVDKTSKVKEGSNEASWEVKKVTKELEYWAISGDSDAIRVTSAKIAGEKVAEDKLSEIGATPDVEPKPTVEANGKITFRELSTGTLGAPKANDYINIKVKMLYKYAENTINDEDYKKFTFELKVLFIPAE